MKKTIFSFYTLGCRLNQSEEEKMRREVLEAGFLISSLEKADICIINTCSVTALADKKSRQVIHSLKRRNPGLKLVVTGCGAKESNNMEGIDLVVLNKDKARTFKIVNEKYHLLSTKRQASQKLNIEKFNQNSKLKIKNSSARTRALLKIQDGCNNFCAYCIVPFLRGREISISVKDVLKEAKKLDKLGYQELVLTGVNVGQYKDSSLRGAKKVYPESSRMGGNLDSCTDDNNSINLSNLIQVILKETSFPRIRLSSINPQDITSEMIDLWSKETRLCRHFHLSLQSGSDTVLKRMRRPYTAEYYKKLSNKIVQKIPDMAITTDVIVGFPGETEGEFKETLRFVKQANLAKIHVFRYSNRFGTRASDMQHQVPSDIKKSRSALINRSSRELEKKFRERFIGKELDVLFEEKKSDFWYGLTSNYIRIKYKSDKDLYNKILKINLNKSNLLE